MVSLGCPKNTVDGEVLLGDLVRAGFDITDDQDQAEVLVVNTCAFVEDAKNESLDAILAAAELKAASQGKRLVLTGCLAQRYGKDLAEQVPEADLIVGFERYGELAGALKEALGMPPGSAPTGERVRVGAATVPFRPESGRHRLTPPHTAYLRVAEGCSHACTFCAIPGFRGKFRSKPWDDVVAEARRLAEEGVVELNLIAEDTNQYGMDFPKTPGTEGRRSLAELLRELGKIEGLKWMRILYAYPSYFSEELIDEIATNPKVCKYIDIPLQHISNLVLLAMNRPPQQHTVALLRKLRDRIPGLVLRTTFISGFPGESDAAHRELVGFAKDMGFERMGAFAYSEEDGTPAADLPEQVDHETRESRRDELVSLAQDMTMAFAQSLVGTEVDVLVDGYSEEGDLLGRTQWDAPDIDPYVFLSDADDPAVPRLAVGQVRRCRVEGVSVMDLIATPVC